MARTADRFYVYEHMRNDAGVVFYVGKGTGRRACSRYGRSDYWNRIVSKAGGFSVRMVADCVDEDFAFLVEMERVDQLRRLGFNLCNMTDGGEGSSGWTPSKEWKTHQSQIRIGRGFKEETRKKLSDSHKGKKKTPEHIAKIVESKRGFIHSDTTKKKMSDAQRNRNQNERSTAYAKMAMSKIGVPMPKVTCPHCMKTGGAGVMTRWHFDNCKENK